MFYGDRAGGTITTRYNSGLLSKYTSKALASCCDDTTRVWAAVRGYHASEG